jgi:hypothetical protein
MGYPDAPVSHVVDRNQDGFGDGSTMGAGSNARASVNKGALRRLQSNPENSTSGGTGRVQHSPRAGGRSEDRTTPMQKHPSEGSPTAGQPTGKTVEVDYVARDEVPPLGPLKQQQKELSRVLAEIETADWPDIFHVVTNIRALSIHHSELLLKSNTAFKQLMKGLLKQVANLRSQVAKNAIIAIGDLCIDLGKNLDGEVGFVASALIKRLCDSSAFLSESCEASLTALIDNCTPTRTLAAFLMSQENRSPGIRGKAARLLVRLVENRAEELKSIYQRDSTAREFDSLFQRIPKLIADNTPEARASGREIVRLLIFSNIISSRDLSAYVPADAIDKAIREASMTNPGSPGPKRSASPTKSTFGRTKSHGRTGSTGGSMDDSEYDSSGVGGASLSPHPPTRPRPGVSNRPDDIDLNGAVSRLGSDGDGGKGSGSPKSRAVGKPSTRKLIDANPELHGLNDMIQAVVGAKNWMDKRDAISKLADVIVRYTSVLVDIFKLDVAMDMIISGLQDGSTKVRPAQHFVLAVCVNYLFLTFVTTVVSAVL